MLLVLLGTMIIFFGGNISHLDKKRGGGGGGGGLSQEQRFFSWEKMVLCCHIMNNFSLKSPYLDKYVVACCQTIA
jgi:hypothetical protein